LGVTFILKLVQELVGLSVAIFLKRPGTKAGQSHSPIAVTYQKLVCQGFKKDFHYNP
jgi:hypothetical protein